MRWTSLHSRVQPYNMSDLLKELATRIVAILTDKGLTLATAESCTGGSVAAAITSVPGSSQIFLGGVVSYSNEVKHNVLGVSDKILSSNGAVSRETVEAMALGVSRLMNSDCSLATSGIAGPGGGTDTKPVGTVWIAVNFKGEVISLLLQLENKGRDANICSFAENVLSLLLKTIENKTPSV